MDEIYNKVESNILEGCKLELPQISTGGDSYKLLR